MHSKNTFFSKKTTINCGSELIDLTEPKVMGILNVTPDSFYDGGKFSTNDAIIKKVEQMLDEGADFIDIGAYSSRPGAEDVTLDVELSRLESVLKLINHRFKNLRLSVDTFRAEVAKRVVLEHGVQIINDISAGELDANMFKTIQDLKIPYVMMHMQGNPSNMQHNPEYENLIKDIIRFFHQKVAHLQERGICDILIDPGFGFGKTLEQNYQLLNQLDSFQMFELPILVGVSRKSMIYRALESNPNEALNGTTVLHTICLQKGANILRVHDVKEAKESIKLVEKLKSVN